MPVKTFEAFVSDWPCRQRTSCGRAEVRRGRQRGEGEVRRTRLSSGYIVCPYGYSGEVVSGELCAGGRDELNVLASATSHIDHR